MYCKKISDPQIKKAAKRISGIAKFINEYPYDEKSVEYGFLEAVKWMQENMKPTPRVTDKDRLLFRELFEKSEGINSTAKWKDISSITGFSVQTIRLSLKTDEEVEESFYNPNSNQFF